MNMDLSQAVCASINEMQESGKLKEIIDSHTHKTIEGIVSEMFRWGDAHKSLAAAIKESAGIEPGMLSLPNLQVLIAQQASQAYEEAILKLGLNESRRLVDEFLKIPKAGPLKLSEMVEALKGEIDKDEDNLGEEITLIVEKHDWSKDSFSVYLDPRPDHEKHSCRVDLHISGGRILSAKLAGAEYGDSYSIRSKGVLRLGYPDALENLIIHAYTTNREINLDEDHCNLCIHEED